MIFDVFSYISIKNNSRGNQGYHRTSFNVVLFYLYETCVVLKKSNRMTGIYVIYIYQRFIVHLPMGLVFVFITFLLHEYL